MFSIFFKIVSVVVETVWLFSKQLCRWLFSLPRSRRWSYTYKESWGTFIAGPYLLNWSDLSGSEAATDYYNEIFSGKTTCEYDRRMDKEVWWSVGASNP